MRRLRPILQMAFSGHVHNIAVRQRPICCFLLRVSALDNLVIDNHDVIMGRGFGITCFRTMLNVRMLLQNCIHFSFSSKETGTYITAARQTACVAHLVGMQYKD
ncbi:hypothetical protein WI94_09760 [Burkholderia vietnamiensis]|nr:hypothetical protein WI94_09760 [Burkholderia vietnamiensis]KVE85369.1 hypothetical protein WJ00_17000 [Burkholderia vietnamiensis]